MQKLVITGALGHIGSRLIRDLPARFPGAEVVMLDNMLVQRYCSLFGLPAEGRYRFVEGDVQEADLEALFRGSDAVVHLAAVTNAAQSFDQAELVERVNYDASIRVGEACAAVGARLVYLSTTSVYGTQEARVDENCREDELKPQSPYADSKLRGERRLAEIAKERGLRFVAFRFGTIYGTSPGMRFHTAVNKFCWQAVMGQPLSVWRTAYDQKRPYLELGDGVEAIGFALEQDLFDGQIYNVLTANHTVREIVETIGKFVPGVRVEFVDTRIMNQLSYEVADDKIKSRGFVVRGEIERGIGDTVRLLAGAQSARRGSAEPA